MPILMDPLARLFGSPARLKLLRLFLFNGEMSFTTADAAFRTKVAVPAARKEIALLFSAGIIRKKQGSTGVCYTANQKFTHFEALRAFLRASTNVGDADMVKALKRAGSLRVVALSGLFTGAIETKVDLLIVGDKLEDKPLEAAVRSLEAELGREVRYAAFSTEDFRYRVGVYDRLVRDVFDYPHRTILDKIGLT
jgi:hypothetical protein